jgi:hypothetical protein
MKSAPQKVAQRPAETGGGIGSIVFVIGRALGWPQDLTNALAVIAGAAPIVITFLVERFRRTPAPTPD